MTLPWFYGTAVEIRQLENESPVDLIIFAVHGRSVPDAYQLEPPFIFAVYHSQPELPLMIESDPCYDGHVTTPLMFDEITFSVSSYRVSS